MCLSHKQAFWWSLNHPCYHPDRQHSLNSECTGTTGVAAPGGGYVTKPVGCGAQTGCVVGEAKIATAVYSEGNMVLVSTIVKITKNTGWITVGFSKT